MVNLNNLKYSIIDKIIGFLLSPRINTILKPLTDIAYSLYERYLLKQIMSRPLPKHVAIIPDGNRRWAKERGLNPSEGHEYGYRKMREVLRWLYDLGINVVTVYAMSYENCLKRSSEERQRLFNIIKRGLIELEEDKILEKYNVRFKIFGKLEIVDEDIIEYARELEKKTMYFNSRFLNIAICYGGRQEILEAVKIIIKEILEDKLKINDITEDILIHYLSTSHLPFPEPDLVIRTSGELRISNFLLWQIAYSELYFCDVYWPDFRKIDLYRAIRSYQNRERRLGS
ncbi:MAG: polyprenyl diphosphate synthase [Ignisphaera sp.]|uniref:Tritrans,polycis-undecaprenyl-diphosphate synthase (geranylgeranyl-diphosphate specific) n=1 Tax=Ignisphaera aggregans TaxID=334771 RepID=A0A7C4NJV3_9CREN